MPKVAAPLLAIVVLIAWHTAAHVWHEELKTRFSRDRLLPRDLPKQRQDDQDTSAAT
jgi:hypothetical protein